MLEKRREERRKKGTDFKERQFHRRERVFYYHRKVFLTDTNAYSNVYFAQYFDFIGEARESLLQYLLGKDAEAFLKTGIVLVTVEVGLKYLTSSYLFDDLKIEVQPKRTGKMKITLGFKVFNETRKGMSAEGEMVIATVLEGKPIPIPELLVSRFRDLFENGKSPK